MSIYSERNAGCRVGGKMIRISISFFYELGAVMRSVSTIRGGQKLGDIWVPLLNAQTELTNLLASGWFLPAIRSTYAPAQKLVGAIKPLTDRTDLDTEITPYEAWTVTNALSEFETTLKNELAIADAYFVTSKGAYDTTSLVTAAERIFPVDLLNKVPHAIIDIREAGKCLAFELSTASGFHALRATESVLRSYWDAIAKGKPHPEQKNIGVYLNEMAKGHLGSDEVRAVLQQIKDLHRNPLMHPEAVLTLDDAMGLMGICQSAIRAMLKEIPVTTSVAVPLGAVAA